MLRYTIRNSYDFSTNSSGSESTKNLSSFGECVTFHRIFRLVDPFVKVHILIIKLDRFSLAPFSPFVASVVVSPPHVFIQAKIWQYFALLAVRQNKSGFRLILTQFISARRVKTSKLTLKKEFSANVTILF